MNYSEISNGLIYRPLAMYNFQYSEQLISITVHILKRHSFTNIQTLKRVLTYIPSPAYTRQVITTAITQLSETSPETTCWLLQHPESLQPELNAREIITHHLSNKLTSWGFVPDRDFYFTAGGQLITSRTLRETLLAHPSTLISTDQDAAVLSVICALLSG